MAANAHDRARTTQHPTHVDPPRRDAASGTRPAAPRADPPARRAPVRSAASVRTVGGLLALAAAAPLSAATILVPGDAPTIQAALAMAADGDEIVVAPGTWPGPVDLLGRAVHLRSSDGPAATFIASPGIGSPFLFADSGETAATIVEGFTVTGGDTRFVPGPPAALVVDGSSPTFRDVVFAGNRGRSVGAVLVTGDAAPRFEACRFEENGANEEGYGFGGGSGGAMRVEHPARVVVEDGVFVSNAAWESGGALSLVGAGASEIRRTRFEQNHARTSGGAVLSMQPLVLEEVEFVANEAEQLDGGGLYLLAAPAAPAPDLRFESNRAGRDGGGLFLDATTGTLELLGGWLQAGDAGRDGGNAAVLGGDLVLRGTVVLDGVAGARGGGVALGPGTTALLDDVQLVSNAAAGDGGAVHADGASLVLQAGLLASNAAGGHGGGAALAGGVIDAQGTVLTSNDAAFDGGGIRAAGATLVLADLRLLANEAARGGGLALDASAADALVAELRGNVAQDDGGAALVANASTLRLRGATVVANRAGGDGGAVLVQDAFDPAGALRVEQAIVLLNRAGGRGGAVRLENGDAHLVAATMSHNAAVQAGGVDLAGASDRLVIESSVAWHAFESPDDAGAWVPGAPVQADDGGSVLVRQSGLEGGLRRGWQGEGVVAADPGFRAVPSFGADGAPATDDDDEGDLALAMGSPLIDAGNGDAVPDDVVADLAGAPRRVDDPFTADGDPSGEAVDAGAYEFQPVGSPCPTDLDGDGVTGFGDVVALLGDWGPCDGCPGDLDEDGRAGLSDLVRILVAWGPCPPASGEAGGGASAVRGGMGVLGRARCSPRADRDDRERRRARDDRSRRRRGRR